MQGNVSNLPARAKSAEIVLQLGDIEKTSSKFVSSPVIVQSLEDVTNNTILLELEIKQILEATHYFL